MTDWGTFIINGIERVVVTQLVRSPARRWSRRTAEAGIHAEPDAGLAAPGSARDRQEGSRLRPHRPQAQAPVSVLLRAMGDTLREGGYVPEGWTGSDEEILGLFDDSLYIRLTLDADTGVTKSEEEPADRPLRSSGQATALDRRGQGTSHQLFFDLKRRPPRVGLPGSTFAPPTSTRSSTPTLAPGHHQADPGAHLAPARARHPRVEDVRGR